MSGVRWHRAKRIGQSIFDCGMRISECGLKDLCGSGLQPRSVAGFSYFASLKSSGSQVSISMHYVELTTEFPSPLTGEGSG